MPSRQVGGTLALEGVDVTGLGVSLSWDETVVFEPKKAHVVCFPYKKTVRSMSVFFSENKHKGFKGGFAVNLLLEFNIYERFRHVVKI